MVQTLLSGEYPTQAPWWSNIALVFVVCVVTALLGRFVAPGVLLGCAAALLVGLYFLSTSLLAGPGATYLEPVTASAGVVVASLLEIGFMFLAERRDRESVKRQLVRHVGEGVAEKLTDEEWPEGQGEACKITMLFSDLQGFTSISETMTPPEICSLLNRYFGVVMPILDEHHGTLDKLIGDGMMAYFGWPARSPEHATNAIKCAVAVQQALEEWQRQPENAGMPPLRTRIGIHTGEVVIGEVGSGTRVEFTVIGDVVNVASRLEGMNKEYGTTILVSEDSRDLAGAIVPYQYRGVATMRGRREPMPVYSIDPGPASGRQRTATGSRATAARTAAAGSETAPGGAGTQPAPDGGTTERLD
jgi:adenylate cyclase